VYVCNFCDRPFPTWPFSFSLNICIVSALLVHSPAGCTWILPELSHLEPPLVECNWRPTPTKDLVGASWASCDDGRCICTEKCLICQWGSRTNHSFGRKQPVASNLLLLQPVAQLGLLQTITDIPQLPGRISFFLTKKTQVVCVFNFFYFHGRKWACDRPNCRAL